MSTHESRSAFTTSMTKGRGLIVSRLPLGICSTRLIVLGMTVTILEPRSTRRFSHMSLDSCVVEFAFAWDGSSSSLFAFCARCTNVTTGANWASCAVVVKITKPDAIAKELALLVSNTDCDPGMTQYNLPEYAWPTNSRMGSTTKHVAQKQCSGKAQSGETTSWA